MHSPRFRLDCSQKGEVRVILSGYWTLQSEPPNPGPILSALVPEVRHLHFAEEGLGNWDTRLLIFLQNILNHANTEQRAIHLEDLPSGVRDLLHLSATSPKQSPSLGANKESFITRVGNRVLDLTDQSIEIATFIGEIILAFMELLGGKRPFKSRDFFGFVQSCGVESLPIVSLIAVLVGVILSFVGAVQLQMFGAQIYVANLVGLGMVLEMGALMSGVIIAGRIGASYAAQLGTMQVNEEIDALRTMGISPVGFLVLPRMLALMLMLPLLCIYADIMGILGGSIIGVSMLDLSLIEFLEQTRKTLTLNQCGQGLLKSSIFGVLIGFAGCLRGMQCGRSALAVGAATTSAVVTSIVLIVVSDSIITYFLYR
ncbi:ABC transporter permease [Desulfobulbus rhabdoformis]|uniref:MlaE family ABC transporter permease n=1 Tax=Desulfobulbus rhabdoformis TaxID=34032 RepID=UPI0019643134|nr:ABC transporter permease [Desulfobulbus rhabdoformis]MBM9614184.1 ABC transporter permease [Desulfobulbus rhabdoformis]